MTAMQAGLSVATQGLRPGMPPGTDPAHAWLITECWAPVADQRPTFADIVGRLEGMLASGVAEGLPPLAPHSGSSQGREEAGAYGASGLQESGRTGTTAGSSGSAGGQPLPPPQQPRQELATRHGVPRPVPCAARALGGGGGGRGAPGDPGVVPRALVAWGAGKGAQQPPAHGRVQRMVGPPPMLHRRITHTGV